MRQARDWKFRAEFEGEAPCGKKRHLHFARMSFGKILLFLLGVLVVLAIIVALALSGIFNRLVTLQQGTDAAWAQVQNVYQRRADLIPNLVNTVTAWATFAKSKP